MCHVLLKSNAKREKRQGKKNSNRKKRKRKLKNKCVEKRNMNLGRKRAQGKIAKWSKTKDYMCDMEMVRVRQKHMELGEQIRKMENPRESEMNQ